MSRVTFDGCSTAYGVAHHNLDPTCEMFASFISKASVYKRSSPFGILFAKFYAAGHEHLDIRILLDISLPDQSALSSSVVSDTKK